MKVLLSKRRHKDLIKVIRARSGNDIRLWHEYTRGYNIKYPRYKRLILK